MVGLSSLLETPRRTSLFYNGFGTTGFGIALAEDS